MIFSEFLQPLREFRTQRVAPIDRPPQLTVTGEMSLSIRSSRSRVSLPLDVTVGDEDELEEDVEQ